MWGGKMGSIDLTKATGIAREWIKENRVMNLFYHMFCVEQAKRIGYEDKWLVICSLQEDFKKRTYYVFEITFEGIILKIGIGYLDGDTIRLKEYKLKWETDALEHNEKKDDKEK